MEDLSPDKLFVRNIMLYGDEGFRKLRHAFVAVVGVGGVGSFCAEMLTRAGVGRLRIIDCDVIKPTDINRQILALTNTLGESKVETQRARLLSINPHLSLDVHHSFFHHDTAGQLITPDLDYVVDAIDSLNPKVELLHYCVREGIRVISAMGAAGRTDPFRVRVGTLSETSVCPLARAVRQRLKRRGIGGTMPVIYSIEPPVRGCQPPHGPSLETEGTYLRGRPRAALPSLPTIPAFFGLLAAHHVIWALLGRA